MRIAIIGGSGFVGGTLADVLAMQNHEVVILSRKASSCSLPSKVMQQVYDPHRLSDALPSNCDCVINLVGILNTRILHPQDFQTAHVELVQHIVEACRTVGIRRYIHIGALHASAEGPSVYLKTKYAGEALAFAAEDMDVTSFRPSVIFGPKDSFLNRFAQLLNLLPIPILPLACADTRFAPVYVNDLTLRVIESINNKQTIGQIINLCGPKQYTLAQIVLYVARLLTKRVKIIALSDPLTRLQARFCDWVPGKPFSYDNYLSLQIDSVCEKSDSICLTPLENIAPLYIGK